MLFGNFLIATIFGFLGSLQPGSVNTLVINDAFTDNKRRAFNIAIGGSMVQGLGAWLVARGLSDSLKIPDISFILLSLVSIALGLYYFLKKNIPKLNKESNINNKLGILKGMTMAFINPQILPFWAFIWVTFGIKNNNLSNSSSFIFSFGAFLGTLSVLTTLIILSNRFKSFDLSVINRITGSVLIFVGILAFIKWM